MVITATRSAEVASGCGACGGVPVRDPGQFVERGLLRRGVEGRCRSCPEGWCETGTGPAPEEIRQALLARHGPARLRLAGQPGRGGLVPVLRALRETYGLPLGETRLMAAELSGAGLSGTFVERAYLAQGLRKRSVATTLAPPPPA
ncbi:hypothetical protein ABZ800_32395 [Streptomyces sp. NPDC047813]|uniref:hypothetical protein n=1 Tax=Streptomyces sp. NPDC047813 TaxID=3154608 RepID=UPI0033E2012F